MRSTVASFLVGLVAIPLLALAGGAIIAGVLIGTPLWAIRALGQEIIREARS